MIAIFVFLCTFLISTNSHALSVHLGAGGQSFDCADGAGCDSDPMTGVVHATTNLNGIALSINTTGTGLPTLGSPQEPDLDLSSVVTTNGNPGTIHVAVSQDGFIPPSLDSGGFYFAIGGTTRGVISAGAYGDLSNALFGQGQTIASLGPFTRGPFSGSTKGSLSFSGNSPYSLTIDADITPGSGPQITSFDAELFATPEPTTLALVGMGFILLGKFGRQRKLFA